MSVNASKSRFPVDASLILRATGIAAVTADANTDALNLNVLGAYWESTSNPAVNMDLAAIVTVTAGGAQTGAADETYTLEVHVDDTTAFSGSKTILSKAITGTGTHVLTVSREAIAAALTSIGAALTTGYLRVTMNVAGTAPSIAFDVYVSPLVG